MSQGKYSPTVYGKEFGPFNFNCYGKEPAAWNPENSNNVEYDEKTMFTGYDSEGYDSYGYSAFYADGSYAGVCNGVDRNGYTELEYMCMTEEEFAQFW